MRTLRSWIVVALVVAAVAVQAQRVRYLQTQTVTNATTFTVCTNAGSTPTGCLSDVGTTGLYCTIETGPLRWLANGTAPTTTVGHLAQAGTGVSVGGTHANIAAFRMIATTATSAVVTCEITGP